MKALEGGQMKAAHNPERRDKVRLPYVCPISVKDLKSGESCAARVFNYSDNGFYFESDSLLEQGAEVFIGFHHSPFEDQPSDYAFYRMTIMWRKELAPDSHFHYSYGGQIHQQEGSAEVKPPSEKRKFPRKPFMRQVRFSADHKISEGFTVDISRSGIYVNSGERLTIGAVITMRIPDKHGKEVVVQGRVVWSGVDGFGVKFIAR
jgi:hypothetical protein